MQAFTSQRERWILSGIATIAVAGLAYNISRGSSTVPTITLAREPNQSQKSADPITNAPVTGELIVHVVGAVKKPGILKLPPNTRVFEAIERAGGATANADLSQLNLAAKIEDGSQLNVATKGKATDIVAAKSDEPYQPEINSLYSSKPAPTVKATPRSSSVNLNTASAAQLDTLPGVGPSTAAKILAYRREHGGFASIDELLSVKGIGPKKLAAMRKFLKL